MCGEFARAVKLCLAAGDDAGIAGAIAVVKRCAGRPEREPLVRLLHDHLTGDLDGKAKDPNHGTRVRRVLVCVCVFFVRSFLCRTVLIKGCVN